MCMSDFKKLSARRPRSFAIFQRPTPLGARLGSLQRPILRPHAPRRPVGPPAGPYPRAPHRLGTLLGPLQGPILGLHALLGTCRALTPGLTP